MTGPQYGATPGGSWQPPAGQPPFGPPPIQKQGRGLTIVSLLVAVVAVIAAIASWFRPSDTAETRPTDATINYSAEDQSAAKEAICEAHSLINEALSVAGNKTSDDPEMRFVVAINSRLAGTAAADYLNFVSQTHPATPDTLRQPLNDLISAHAEITLLALADADRPRLQKFYDKLDKADAQIVQECG